MAHFGATTVDDLQDKLQFVAYANRTYPDFPQDITAPALSDSAYLPPHIGYQVICATAITTALSVAVVAARLTARYFRTRGKLGFDDWFIIVATIAQIAFFVVQVCAVRYGCIGYNVYDCTRPLLVTGFHNRYAGFLLYLTTAMAIKISVCFFCLRLATARLRSFRRVVQGTLAVLVITYVVSVLQSAFPCTPIRASWDIWTRIELDVACQSEWRSVLAWSVIYSLQDIWLFGLSAWLTLRLSLLKQSRFGIILIFAFGLAAAICSIIKWPIIKKAYFSYNATWHLVPVLIYSQLECALGLIAASLPALSFLLVSIVPSRFREANSNRSSMSSMPPAKQEKSVVDSTTSAEERSPDPETKRLSNHSRTRRWPSIKLSKGAESQEKTRDGARSGQGQRRDMRTPSPFDGLQEPVIISAAGPSNSPQLQPYEDGNGAITRTIRINQSFEPSGRLYEPLTLDPPSVFRFDPATDVAPLGRSTRSSSRLRPQSVADDMSIDLVIQGHTFGNSESDSMGTIYEGSR